MIFLYFLIFTSFLTIGVVLYNREEISYETETASYCDCCNIINLDNDKYYVELTTQSENKVVIRVCFKNNNNIFLSSQRYTNKSHAVRKAKELAMYLKCELKDLR